MSKTPDLKLWMKETTKFPITNIILAKNYLEEFYGIGVYIGIKTAKEIISADILPQMIEIGWVLIR